MIIAVIFPRFFSKVNFSKNINGVIFKVKNALGKELKKKRRDTFFTIDFLHDKYRKTFIELSFKHRFLAFKAKQTFVNKTL